MALKSCQSKAYKAVTTVLKPTYMQIENYNFKIENYSGVKTYWSVQNNHAIKHNEKKKIQEIKSLQFLPLIYPPYIRIFCITN